MEVAVKMFLIGSGVVLGLFSAGWISAQFSWAWGIAVLVSIVLAVQDR